MIIRNCQADSTVVYRYFFHYYFIVVNPHCFKFEKVDSKVVMYYRKWSQDEWMGPINILKDNRPTGPPPLVQPSLNRQDIEGIKRDMPKFFGHMKATQKEFWEKIISNPDDLISSGSSANWPLERLRNPRRPRSSLEAESAIPNEIRELREKETASLAQVRGLPVFISFPNNCMC